MGPVLLDTNVLIDHFKGVSAATNEIAIHDDLAISAITWMEVAVGLDAEGLAAFDTMIAAFKAGTGKKLATPDAVILASANITNRQLVTRNPADFGAASAPVRVPYKLTDGVVSEVAPSP
jgi:predicted nucleic acid-binding protein